MAQLSRPYQIGLLAVALLAAAWLLLFQGHSSNTASSGSSTPVAGSSGSASTSSPSPSTASPSVHPGSTSGPTAPGVAGLTRAIAKAQGAVKTSETNAKQLGEKSEQASSAASAPSSASSTATSAKPSSTGTSSAAATSKAAAPSGSATSSKSAAPSKSAAKHAPSTSSAAAPSAAKSAPSTAKTTPAHTKAAPGAATRTTANQRQLAVESELHKGKIVVILFWNPNGTDDRAVHTAVERLAHGGGVAVEVASAKEVASFGSITRGVQVYGTPTTLIVNGKGKATTLTGLQDSYGIKQAIQEARNA
jgi:hypothetical protein